MARPRSARLLALTALLHLRAAADEQEARLLEVEALTPRRLEPGTRVRIDGAGFPPGREGFVVFEGRARAPGEAPRRVRHRAEARAVSPEKVELVVDDALVEGLGGRVTFDGSVTVGFSAASSGVVTGRLASVELDVSADSSAHLPEELARARRARETARRLGLEVEPRDGEGGLRVVELDEAGPAAAAGVQVDDRIVALEGIRVATATDLVPPPGLRRVRATLTRPGVVGPVHLSIPLDTGEVESDTPARAAIAILALCLLWVLCVGPGSRAVPWLIPRRLPPLRPLLRRPRRLLLVAALLAAASLVLATVGSVGRVRPGGLDVAVLLLALFAARLAPLSRPGSLRTRVVALLAAIRDVAPAAGAVLAVTLWAGTSRADGLSAGQGLGPLAWHVFASPFAFALFPAYAAATLGRAPGGVSGGWLSQAHLLLAAGLGAVLFLGGWAGPTRALGLVAFLGKSWVLVALGAHLRRDLPWTTRVEVTRWAAPYAVACVLATGAALAAEVPRGVPLAPVLLVVTAVAAIVGTVRHARSPAAPPLLHPHL